MGLVPHVLACIYTYSADGPKHECLSVLFELTRDWKTPEIYQFNQTWPVEKILPSFATQD